MSPAGGRLQRRDVPGRRRRGSARSSGSTRSAAPAAGPAAVEVDAAVLRLVRGLLPVPEVLEVRRARPAQTGTPGLLVTSFLPGERLDLCLPDSAGRPRGGGHRAGPGPAAGWRRCRSSARACSSTAPADRAVPRRRRPDRSGWRATGRGARWRPGRSRSTTPCSARRRRPGAARRHRPDLPRAQRLQPEEPAGRPRTGRVTGVLDWEFAHAGLPVADLGNLLRFEREPVFADAVLAAYVDTVPDACAETLRAGPRGGPLRARRPRGSPRREPRDRAGRRPAPGGRADRRPVRRTLSAVAAAGPVGLTRRPRVS